MKIFLIPGLGYDKRIFEKLDFKNKDVHFIDWIEPKRNEPIRAYARRLFEKLPKNGEEIILIGHSLGAIVSQEIAAEMNIKKIIIISSIQSREEMPISFKVIKPFKLYKLFTKGWTIKTVKYWGKSHGFTSQEFMDLFKSMVGKQSNHYLQWALKTLSGWKPSKFLAKTELFQIHGTNDKTFPIKLIQNPNVVIENGSHILLYTEPEKINDILMEQIN